MLARTAHLFASSHCLLRSRAPLRSFVRSLAPSLAPELMEKRFLSMNWMRRFHEFHTLSTHNALTHLSFSCAAEPKRLKRIVYEGKPGASSSFGGNKPSFAFLNDGNSWRSGDLPASVWYQFWTKKTLRKITLMTHKDRSQESRLPVKFEVIGSHDCNNWNVLLQVQFPPMTNN